MNTILLIIFALNLVKFVTSTDSENLFEEMNRLQDIKTNQVLKPIIPRDVFYGGVNKVFL